MVSANAIAVLKLMQDDKDYFGELVEERRQWWVGANRVSSAACKELLTFCLLRDVSDEKGMRRYVANCEAKELLKDPSYVPLITPVLKELVKDKRKQSRKHSEYNGKVTENL